jgi:hypothetical protein
MLPMVKKNAGKSTLGALADLPIEAQFMEDDGAGREAIEARLTAEIGCLNNVLLTASPDLKKELILLVECLRAARQVVERSVSFKSTRD